MFPTVEEAEQLSEDELLRLLDAEVSSRAEPGIHPASPAGPALACDVEVTAAAAERDRVDDEQLLDVVAAVGRLRSWLSAIEHRMLARYADRHPDGDGRTARWLADEVGMLLSVPREQASAMLRDAQRMVHVLPDTLAALETGEIDRARADTIRRTTDTLDPEQAREVERRVMPHAAGATRKQVYQRCYRAVVSLDPHGARRRQERLLADRRVSISHSEDGMANLWMSCSAADAQASWESLTRLARSLGKDDPRTLDQRRVDLAHQLMQGTLSTTDLGSIRSAVDSVLAAAAGSGVPGADDAGNAPTPDGAAPAGSTTDGTPGTPTATHVPREPNRPDAPEASDGPGRPGTGAPPIPPAVLAEAVAQALARKPDPDATIGRKPLIQVVVALDTLLGGDRPADLVGHGPIPAATARAVALGGIWQRVVTDPLTGHVVDVGRNRYRPTAEMADFVRARDRVCRGCGRRLHDLDHHQAWAADHGETRHDNLNGYCRRCHVLKDQPGWQVLSAPDGTVTQISPNGATRTTRPWDHRDLTEPFPIAMPPVTMPPVTRPSPGATPDSGTTPSSGEGPGFGTTPDSGEESSSGAAPDTGAAPRSGEDNEEERCPDPAPF